jgi:hypothetical protein
MTRVAVTQGPSRRGAGLLILLGFLALGVVAALGADDVRRYLRMRRM